MRWILYFGAMLSFLVPVAAGAETFQTLTTLEVLNADSQMVQIPTSEKVELIQYHADGRVEFSYQGKTYFIDRYEFIHSVETTSSEQQVLADLMENQLGATLADPSQCPLDAQGHLKAGVKWNYAAAKLIVEHCPAYSVAVVKRTWTSPWKASCRPSIQDLSRVSKWVSCAPPPACTVSQAIAKNAGAKKRLEAWKLKCAGRNVSIPTDNDPVCTLPLGAPHTLVIHQTEGNMTDGPDALQRFHLNKGWDDVGYHYILTKTSSGWRAFEGRVDGSEGSHAGAGINAQSIGISVAGNFLPSANRGKPTDQVLPPPEAIHLLKSLTLQVKAQYPTIKNLYGHGEFKRKGMGCDTDCPSPSLQQFVNQTRTVYFPSHKSKK